MASRTYRNASNVYIGVSECKASLYAHDCSASKKIGIQTHQPADHQAAEPISISWVLVKLMVLSYKRNADLLGSATWLRSSCERRLKPVPRSRNKFGVPCQSERWWLGHVCRAGEANVPGRTECVFQDGSNGPSETTFDPPTGETWGYLS